MLNKQINQTGESARFTLITVLQTSGGFMDYFDTSANQPVLLDESK